MNASQGLMFVYVHNGLQSQSTPASSFKTIEEKNKPRELLGTEDTIMMFQHTVSPFELM